MSWVVPSLRSLYVYMYICVCVCVCIHTHTVISMDLFYTVKRPGNACNLVIYVKSEQMTSFVQSLNWRLFSWSWACRTFTVKIQRVIFLSFVGHMVFIAMTQLCCWSVKAAIDNMQMNKHGCVSIKLYLKKTSSGQDLACGPISCLCLWVSESILQW